jgi:hypothetical protein
MSSTNNYRSDYKPIKFESSFSYRDEMRRIEEESGYVFLNNKEQLRPTWIPQKEIALKPVFIKQQFMRIFKGRLFPIGG